MTPARGIVETEIKGDHHYGPHPMYGWTTVHVGPIESCPLPDCHERLIQPRDELGRFVAK